MLLGRGRDLIFGPYVLLELLGVGGRGQVLKDRIILIKGDKVYQRLKFESGVHRVQRVPETESQGRIQTSTCSVAVMPEAEDVGWFGEMNNR